MKLKFKDYLSTCIRFFLTSLLVLIITTAWGIAPAWSADYNKQSLINSDFSHQDLKDASFDHTNLRDSDLSFIDATGVRFFGANLAQSNLEGANSKLRQSRVGAFDSRQLD